MLSIMRASHCSFSNLHKHSIRENISQLNTVEFSSIEHRCCIGSCLTAVVNQVECLFSWTLSPL